MLTRTGIATVVVGSLFFLAGACGGKGGPAGSGSNRDGAADGSRVDTPAEMSAGDAGGGDTGTNDVPADLRADGVVNPPVDAPPTDVARDAAMDGSTTPPDAQADISGTDTAPDLVSMPCVAPGGCDPFDPAACGAQRCEPGLDGNYSCASTKGTKAAGAACAARAECAGGLDCVRLGDDPATTCTRMCPRGSIGFCGGELRCSEFIVGCVQYCRARPTPCDVYAQNCASPADACTLATDPETRALYTGCRPAGTATRGQSCAVDACARGLLCVREAGVALCRQICTGDGGALPCLAANEACTGLTSTARITYCH